MGGDPPQVAASAPGRWSHVGRRLGASGLDVGIVLVWAGATGALGALLRTLGREPTTAAGWDAYAFATLVLPVTLTFAAFEASPRRATPGKRRLGLSVTDRSGRRLRPARSLARSAVKFAPWQAAHTAVFHLLDGSEEPGLAVLSIGAQTVVLASTVFMSLDREHRALHDLVAGTRVA